MQSTDYEQFKCTELSLRTGLFRGVTGRIDGVPVVVGAKGRKNEIINDSKDYPLPDSLRGSGDIHSEIAQRRFPLSRRELCLICRFMETGFWELSVDSAGNVRGKALPELYFELPLSPERKKKVIEDGYRCIGNNFYIRRSTA